MINTKYVNKIGTKESSSQEKFSDFDKRYDSLSDDARKILDKFNEIEFFTSGLRKELVSELGSKKNKGQSIVLQ